MTTEHTAEAMRTLHPNRVRFALFSDQNPLMQPVKALAETVRAARRPVASDNPLLAVEQAASAWISTWLKAYGTARDMLTEQFFLTTYSAPLLQALLGLGTEEEPARRRAEHDLLRETTAARRRAEIEARFETGGLAEAVIRALIYVVLPERSADERGFTVLQEIRQAQPEERRLSQPALKELFAEQFLIIRTDPERAIRAIPAMLPDEAEPRRAGLAVLRRVVDARGIVPPEVGRRLARVEALFAGALPRTPPLAERAFGTTAPPLDPAKGFALGTLD